MYIYTQIYLFLFFIFLYINTTFQLFSILEEKQCLSRDLIIATLNRKSSVCGALDQKNWT